MCLVVGCCLSAVAALSEHLTNRQINLLSREKFRSVNLFRFNWPVEFEMELLWELSVFFGIKRTLLV